MLSHTTSNVLQSLWQLQVAAEDLAPARVRHAAPLRAFGRSCPSIRRVF